MADHYDALETREPAEREADLFRRLPAVLAAASKAPAYGERLSGVDPAAVTSRKALAALPVLRKSDLPALHKAAPPFGGFVAELAGSFAASSRRPGRSSKPRAPIRDPWRAARGLFAAGFRRGDVVLNTFSYHLTPGGFILDSGARALGCAVIPAGPGNSEQQFDLIDAYRPVAYCGTPDFLKILLDGAAATGRDISSIRRARRLGRGLSRRRCRRNSQRAASLRYQAYATADLGFIAYETARVTAWSSTRI